MRFGFRLKLILLLLLLFTLFFVLGTTVVEKLVRDFWLVQLKASLEPQARLLAALVEKPLGVPTYEKLDSLADSYGTLLALRVTLIDTSGRVWGDSHESGEALKALENHAGRPEVVQALSGVVGSSIRFSSTVGTDMLYLAYPVASEGRLTGVVRLARPLTEVNQALAGIRRSIFLFLLLLFFLLTSIGIWFSYWLSQPVGLLLTVIDRLKRGDFSARAAATGKDEFSALGGALNELAGELEQTLSQLKEQKLVQGITLEALSEGVLAADAEGRIIIANAALRFIFRLAADPRGQPFHLVFRHPALLSAFEKVLKNGGNTAVQIKETFPTHKVVEIQLASSDEGKSVRVVAVFRDVTQSYRLEQVRKDFVANASHELRTPLAVIRGYVETLEDGLVAQPERPQVFQTLNQNIRRMGDLIEDLLHLSKLESPEFTFKPEKVLIREIVQAVLSALKPQAEAKKQNLFLDVPEELPLVGDRRELEVALKNLLENAVHYTGERGKISIGATRTDGAVEITVADTGIGIPSQDLSRIFERFYRVDKSRSKEEGGTGLGLSIVKHIAEAHGGRVEVESEVGKGSKFTLVIPG